MQLDLQHPSPNNTTENGFQANQIRNASGSQTTKRNQPKGTRGKNFRELVSTYARGAYEPTMQVDQSQQSTWVDHYRQENFLDEETQREAHLHEQNNQTCEKVKRSISEL